LAGSAHGSAPHVSQGTLKLRCYIRGGSYLDGGGVAFPCSGRRRPKTFWRPAFWGWSGAISAGRKQSF